LLYYYLYYYYLYQSDILPKSAQKVKEFEQYLEKMRTKVWCLVIWLV